MRSCLLVLAGWMLSISAAASAESTTRFDWSQWRQLPVQDGGRQKPFDTLAWETGRTISNRIVTVDPLSGQRLDANTLYLVMLFDWQGWDRVAHGEAAERSSSRLSVSGSAERWSSRFSVSGSAEHRSGGEAYFQQHLPDRWDELPLVRVDFLALRQLLGMAADQPYISPLEISRATIRVPGVGQERPFLSWAQALAAQREMGLTAIEEKALELADKFRAYQGHRMGQRLRLVPLQGSEDQQWVPLTELVRAGWDDTSDPTGLVREIRQQFLAARAAYLAGAGDDFNRASAGFIAAARLLGSQLGDYPQPRPIGLEVLYNRTSPFRIAWLFSASALVAMLLSLGTGWRALYAAGWAAFLASLLAMLAGFAWRMAIAGRPPVTNMYESVIYVALGIAIFGVVFEFLTRKRYALTAAAALATLALVLADNCPVALDASLHPLQPVLRSNFWLVTHVMTITLSYAALALGLGTGNLALGYHLVGSQNSAAIDDLTNFTYRAIQIGVLLLAAGTALGAVWADYSWGRFWGWDPKEVWALIALLGYLAVLHARPAGWVQRFGLAALSVICFSLVIMAWYGVNFVLGAGLHSYGFSSGGQPYVLAVMGLQLLFVAAAAVQHARQLAEQQQARRAAPRPGTRTAVPEPNCLGTRDARERALRES